MAGPDPSPNPSANPSPNPSPSPSPNANPKVALGHITKWLPADAAAGDGALFHCVHDDGDEEDLEEEEARLSSVAI